MNKESQPISIVIPVFNEAEIIETVIREYHELIAQRFETYEFIVAEDGSTDGTKAILASLGKELSIKVVMGEERKGYLRGLRDALALANHPLVFFSDSDGQHDPMDFWKLYKQANGYDIVTGYKGKRFDPAYRLMMSRTYNLLAKFLFGTSFRDASCGFKLVRKDVLDSVLLDIHLLKYSFSTELLLRANHNGFSIHEVCVEHRPRTTGTGTQFEVNRLPQVTKAQLTGMFQLRRELSRDGGL